MKDFICNRLLTQVSPELNRAVPRFGLAQHGSVHLTAVWFGSAQHGSVELSTAQLGAVRAQLSMVQLLQAEPAPEHS